MFRKPGMYSWNSWKCFKLYCTKWRTWQRGIISLCWKGTKNNSVSWLCECHILKHGLRHLIILIYVSWTIKNGRCRFRPTEVGANCQGIVHVPAGDELSLQKAVGSIGPIVVSLDASKRSFKQYRNGVYDDKACSKKLITHYALIVGYGEFQNKKYWLIKNR